MSVKNNRLRTRRMAISAMLAALGVVLLGVGGFVEVLDLSAAALASLLCIYAVIEMGGAYPWMIWLVTAVLSLLLIPNKSPAVFYLFIGFYPILKEKLEKLPRLLSLLLKLLVFHGLPVLIWLVFKLFFPADLPPGLMLLVTYLLGLAAFWMYDYALSKLITFYLIRLRERFRLK